MEFFLSPEGDDRHDGKSVGKPRKTLPSTLTPKQDEPLMVWLAPGYKYTGALDLSGWQHVRIMPYVPDPKYGGGARLIRDWEESLGEKPYIKTLTIRGSGFSILHLKVETLNTNEQQGTPPSSEEALDGELVHTILKGVEGKTWNGDDWEYTIGTLDDVNFDTINLGASAGFHEVTLTENTNEHGQPKGNVHAKTFYHPKEKTKPKKKGPSLLGPPVRFKFGKQLSLKARPSGGGGGKPGGGTPSGGKLGGTSGGLQKG